MSVFSLNTVTIVRKKGERYVHEDISTRPVLPYTSVSAEVNRRNVIARLRKDPSVIFIFDIKDGCCKEEATLRDGAVMTVEIGEEPSPSASVFVSVEGNEIYRQSFEFDGGKIVDGEDLLWNLCNEVIVILKHIDRGDYGFAGNDCPLAGKEGLGHPVGLSEAVNILRDNGYELEYVHTLGYVISPFLFVDENDVVMLGTTHFQGEEIFLEMKRMFHGCPREKVKEALRSVSADQDPIQVIEWEDGSWSFRASMDDDLYESNFLDKLRSDLAQFRAFIGKIEEILEEEPWPIMDEQRQLFIYEVIATSLQFSRLKI